MDHKGKRQKQKQKRSGDPTAAVRKRLHEVEGLVEKQRQDIERLTADVKLRDEKIREDAVLIQRVRDAEEEAADLRQRLATERAGRIKAEGQKGRKDAKLALRVRELEVALAEAQRVAYTAVEAHGPPVVTEVVLGLQQSQEALRVEAGRLRQQLRTVVGERDAARQERNRATASEERTARVIGKLKRAEEERLDALELEKAAVPEGGGTDGVEI